MCMYVRIMEKHKLLFSSAQVSYTVHCASNWSSQVHKPAFQSKDIPYTAFYASTCTSVVHKMVCCGIYAYAWKHQFLHEWKPGTCTEPFWMYVNIRKHHSVLNQGHCAHPEGCVLHVVACTRQFVHKVNVDIISCGRLCSVCPLPSSASLYTCKDRA